MTILQTMTVSELAEEYILYRVFNEKTAKNYRSFARVFEKESNIYNINGVGIRAITAWKRQMLLRRSNNTFNTYLRHLRVLFKYAKEEGYINENIFVKLSFAPSYKRLPKTVDVNVIKKAMSYLDNNTLEPSWFWQIVLRFLASTGIRRKQLVSIKWADIDFIKKELLLNIIGSKNYREWEIPLTELLLQDLIKIKMEMSLFKEVKLDDQVFNVCAFNRAYKGNQMTAEQLSGFFRRLSNNIGDKISPHRLRHTLGSKLGCMNNVNIFVLQDIFGHSDIRTTRLYVHSNVNDMRKLLDNVEAI